MREFGAQIFEVAWATGASAGERHPTGTMR